jgi:hypothetical protein
MADNSNKKKEYNFTYDEIIINLKLIGEIRIDDKLRIYGNNLDIDNRYMKSIMRTLYNDGRLNTIELINNLIDDGITYSNNLIDKIVGADSSNIENINYKHQLNMLTVTLNTSINGLDKLKITYKSDNIFIANIDLILDKIRKIVSNNMNNMKTIIKELSKTI